MPYVKDKKQGHVITIGARCGQLFVNCVFKLRAQVCVAKILELENLTSCEVKR